MLCPSGALGRPAKGASSAESHGLLQPEQVASFTGQGPLPRRRPSFIVQRSRAFLDAPSPEAGRLRRGAAATFAYLSSPANFWIFLQASSSSLSELA